MQVKFIIITDRKYKLHSMLKMILETSTQDFQRAKLSETQSQYGKQDVQLGSLDS